MSTTMRLKRMGTKKRPYYRIVIQDNRIAPTSKTIDEVGTYRPVETENQVTIDEAKVKSWIQKGAVVSDTVKGLLNNKGISLDRTQG
ncbi:MAG: 30S ribosomal protein S16 [Spirochaetales bacterium]|nr:30S ribosomal protein S16 [Candidatus Physcosoma equi]